MMMLLFSLIRCLVCSIVSLVMVVWFFVGWLKVEVMILFFIVCCMFVIFFGCLLMSMIMRWVLGLLVEMVFVIVCRISVLSVLGGEMIRLCWFLLIGEIRLMICVVRMLGLVFSCSCFCGYSGVSLLNLMCVLVCFGDMLLIVFRCMRVLNLLCCFWFDGLLLCGWCIVLVIVLFLCRLYFFICLSEMYMLFGLGRYFDVCMNV